jgi:peptide deformylase
VAVREILRLGDPRLRQVAAPLANLADPQLPLLLEDLHDTMAAHQGAGLAAPQIGVPLRVVVFGTGAINPRYPQEPPVPRTVLVNPLLTPLGDERQQGWEGCLSVPGLRGRVNRWLRLRIQGFNGEGEAIDQVVEGFHARVVQHECDHLDGVLFPDRLTDPHAFGYVDELTDAGLITAIPT